MKCEQCERDQTKLSIVPGKPGLYCDVCIGKRPIKVTQSLNKQHLAIFTKWHCRTHKCGSYNLNALNRHAWEACDVEFESTVGVIRPKTYGGYNGNVGRDNFPEWRLELKQKDKRKYAISNWNKYSKSKQRTKKRYANRYQRV